MEPVIVVHGGAGTLKDERVGGKLSGIFKCSRAGYEVLSNGGSAIDAVEAAIRIMESDEYFNCGFGSVLNNDGEVEMDASIMDGQDLSAGGVASVRDVEHPISLARLVREKSPHVLIAGPGASAFANDNGMEIIDPSRLVSDHSRKILEAMRSPGANTDDFLGGTVGAVALDKNGNLAAGTSTGGTNGKLLGRIGDTPLIGHGTYADNNYGAVSCTGHGEAIIKMCLSYSIIKEMELGRTARDATEYRLRYLTDVTTSTAGAITLSKTGDIGVYFTATAMPWACIKNGKIRLGLEIPDDSCACGN